MGVCYVVAAMTRRGVSQVDIYYRMVQRFTFTLFSKGFHPTGQPKVLSELVDVKNRFFGSRKTLKQLMDGWERAHERITVTKEWTTSSHRYVQGSFESPVVNALRRYAPTALEHGFPRECHQCHFEMVMPADAARATGGAVVQLAGTGDHFFWRRRTFIANDLATDHGITSIIIENPYYGQRKPKGQMGSSIRYITDLMLIGFGCMAETSVVLRYARAMGIQGKMGITGISLGGFNAAIAASGYDGEAYMALCVAPSQASEVFTEGVLADSVGWPALDAQKQEVVRMLSEHIPFTRYPGDTRGIVTAVLDDVAALSVYPQPVRTDAIVTVAARHDAYIPLQNQLSISNVYPGCEVREVDGGHVTAIAMGWKCFQAAIVAAQRKAVAHDGGEAIP